MINSRVIARRRNHSSPSPHLSENDMRLLKREAMMSNFTFKHSAVIKDSKGNVILKFHNRILENRVFHAEVGAFYTLFTNRRKLLRGGNTDHLSIYVCRVSAQKFTNSFPCCHCFRYLNDLNKKLGGKLSVFYTDSDGIFKKLDFSCDIPKRTKKFVKIVKGKSIVTT